MFKGTAKNRAANIKILPTITIFVGIEAMTTGAILRSSICYNKSKYAVTPIIE